VLATVPSKFLLLGEYFWTVLLIVMTLLQIAFPRLIWRWLRRRGWSKRSIFLAALPIPATAVARGSYLFLTLEQLPNGELASVGDEYRLVAALTFWVGALALYFVGMLVAGMPGSEAPVAPKPETLKDIYE